jgi:hypothetical protein
VGNAAAGDLPQQSRTARLSPEPSVGRGRAWSTHVIFGAAEPGAMRAHQPWTWRIKADADVLRPGTMQSVTDRANWVRQPKQMRFKLQYHLMHRLLLSDRLDLQDSLEVSRDLSIFENESYPDSRLGLLRPLSASAVPQE